MNRRANDFDGPGTDNSFFWKTEEQILLEERRRFTTFDGVTITGSNYPSCLEVNSLDCDDCYFFPKGTCGLRRSQYRRERLWDIIEPWVQRERARREWEERLREAITAEVRGHGRELHYSVIAQMVRERYPGFEISDGTVYNFLHSRPQVFASVAPGVFKLVGSNRGPGGE